MSVPVRIVVPIDSQDPNAWAQALRCAQAVGAKAQPPASEYILLTHTKQQLKHTSLANHIGAAKAKALLANKVIDIPGVGRLRHATLQTLCGSAQQAVIIAYFAEDKMLETIDGLIGLVGVVAVPEIHGEIDTWSARWNPIVYGQTATVPVKLISDTVVEKALHSLTGWVNLSHAVMNTRDKEHANETLRILRAKGHTLEPDKIKSWAIKNAWKPKAADELAKLAAKIQALKAKPSIKGLHNADSKYQSWNK